MRRSTPPLKDSLIEGLLLSGADVTDIGVVPTPVFYFAKDYLGADAGVMITASHNPPEFNGLKLILGPLPITEEELDGVRRIAESGRFADGEGSFRTLDIIPAYRDFLLSVSPNPARRLQLVVDCGNGCYSGIAPDVLRELGYAVEELFCEADGRFPNRSPNSAVPENLTALSEAVRRTHADLGVAFDGDGDRASFVDDRGRFLPSDKAVVILAEYALEAEPGAKIVYDLKCSSAVPEAIEQAAGVPIPERSGHTFVKTRVIIEEAAFGGELSGHYFYRALGGRDDGLYSAAVMAGMLAGREVRFSELADSLPEYATSPDIRVEYQDDRRALVERIAEGFPPDRVSRLDGVKVTFDGGWALARVSVTEPVITLRFEAETDERLEGIALSFLEKAPEIRGPALDALEKSKRASANGD